MSLSIPLHRDMEVLDIKEQGIGVSVSAASGSSSDDETSGHATPASTSTERDAKIGTDELSAEHWKPAPSDHESLSFPTVPRAVNALSPDQAVKYRLSSLYAASDVNARSIIYAAWSLVAGQMTGSQDTVFGVSMLTGDFVENIPFRLRWSKDQHVRSFLLATQKEAIELSSTGAGRPGKISQTCPEAGQACEFQTLVTFWNNSRNVSIGRKPTGRRYALELDVLSRDGEYLVSASSDSRVISASLVDRLLLRLDHVVMQLCSCSLQQTIGEVNLMTEKDLESIWNWNREVPETLDCCVHSIIEDQVRANPGAPGICAWDGNLTYAELNDRAGQVAERLSATGLRPGSKVPLCFDKSMWANVTMLGVLKAGGAVVMLDPMLPEQRLKSIVEQVEAELIVSSPSNYELSSRLCDKVEVVRPQDFDGRNHTSSRCSAKICPSSIAYVQFTSGSTGIPKGSSISHRSISSAIRHQLGPLGFNSRSRVYDFSSYSFDLSIYNALTTLSAGGCLCVPSDSGRKDDLTGSILSLRSNTLTLTPSTAQTLRPEQFPDVKTIVFAGEALRVQDAAPWWKQARVVNIYGPSECTPVSTMSYNCQSPAQVIEIGMGVGMNTWIVDANDHQRLLPPGCIGELILEGPLVSIGYLHNAESNARAYIKDPTWLLQGYGASHPGRHARLYKTGDLVRYNENGSITFVARKDTQVKIRGQRVELDEVETRIQECLPEVVRAAAEVITPKDSNPMLVAFVLQNNNVAQSREALKLYRVPDDARHKIANKLPPYMIPAAYLSIARMPATASGKLDRKHLREIGAALSPERLAEMSVDRGNKKQPSSEAEHRMQHIWGRVLKFKDATLIGVQDNFFQLGGDSITAMKIVRLLRELGLELSVANILRFPVLQDIATRVVDARGDSDETIPPFSLLPEDCDISSVLRSYHLDPGQVKDAFPCTAIQEGLISLSSQRSGDYVTQAILELSHEVSVDRFCYAWSAVVETIPLLRTRFVQGDTGLLQVVLDEQVSWKEVDDLQAYLAEDRKQPMRLGQAFTRHTLTKDATGRVASFVLTAHHALHDGWSLGLIMETLDKAYTGRKADSFPPFQKFIKYIQNEDVDQTSNFWKKALECCESVSFPALPSSLDKPKSDALVSRRLPNSVSKIDATISTMIRAAWALVVGCMVNSDDVVFGATVSGRHAELSGIDQIPGPTIATVPMRFHIDKSQKVTSFLSQSQKQATDMIPHEQMGLARIAKLSSDCEQACKFQTLLVIQPEETGILTNSVGQLREENEIQWSSSYGLVLEVQLGHPQSTITASFDSRLIDSSTVESLLSRLELVIDQIASADLKSAMTIKDINVLTPADFSTLMSWNAVVPETINMCIHEVVHQRAVEKPERPAICAWDGELKYGELDTMSTNLARHLKRIGVEKDSIVPLCFEKSMWTPVAILAVLKAGGAFLLLDPSLPLARLEVMAKHVDAKLILATDTCTQLASSLVGNVITVGTTLLSTLDNQLDDSQFCSDSSSKAYIIFTSGSTGTPKGVVITHSNVISAVTQHSSAFQYEESSRIYDFSSYSFGASLNNMFCALTSGACLCIPNEDDRKSSLAESLTSLRATDVLLTPSMAEHLSPESVPTLRSLILGGEAVRVQDSNQWLGNVTLRTAYGQSETTTVATVNPQPATAEEAMFIGRGVGLVTWVVDPENHENLLPPGSIGELLVEGPAVGHGYFKDPKKTAEFFISDPHWLIKAGRRGRLYKTGDLVRYNEDGTLAYLGRKDSQVKIRGQRIELGDVEYWVREFMMEADQVVVEAVTPKGPGGRPTLAAFIKVNNAEALFEQGDTAAAAKLIRIDAEVEKMLRRQLPSYMVPTIFIAMKSLPMTPTGKMNRRELRNIGGGISAEEVRSIQLANNGPKRQPVTDKEHQMQRVWSQVLGIEQQRIDLNASFFQLGGDSIAAMRVAGTARKMGLGITVAEIFQHHTLRLVAEKSRYTSNNKVSIRPFALVGSGSNASEVRRVISQACRVDPEMIEDAYPCTPLQEGLFSLASKRPGDYIMQAVLELSPKVDIAMFRKAWESAIRAAAALRTRIVHDQKLDLVQVVLNEKPKWHETTGLEDHMQADRAIHMALSTPLSRLALVKNDKGHVQWFVLSMHHALYDGWSLSLIMDMVRDAYSGTDLEEAAFQPFINYVMQQVDDVKTSEYWQAELEGCEFAPYPALPTSVSQPVSDTVVQHLVSRPKDSYLDVTPAILARSAWAIVTSRVTNAEDVVFGVTTSGRNAPVMNIDKMPAPAFATVPVRIQTSAGQRVSDYLEAVQQQAITMIPFEQLGLHRITKISADAQQACSFQTLLLVQQQGTETFGESELGRWQNRDQQEFFNPYALIVEVNLLETGHLSLKAIFDSRIISRWRVEKLLQQFDSVVQQMERARPRHTLGDISTMTEADLQQIWTWNQVVPGPAADICLHQFVEQQAKAHLERIAISVEDAVHVGKGAGINTWVVDPTNANILLPPGSIGELLLEGPVVGLGYLNYPETTARSFIHDPTWLVRGLPGQAGRSGRLFKTGHLVQYDEHGNLNFLGHKDSQVKSRGLPHWQRLRGIGSSFYTQTQDQECAQAAISKRQPETPLERQLQQIWARVLDIDSGTIGLDDSFFHLGGDSVAAIKVASEARKADINITVAELFQYPTLGEAAGQLASHSSDPVEKIAPFALLASKVDVNELASELASQMHASVDIVQDAYQCTPLQVGLLSLSFKRPGDYVMQATIELDPGCDISRFKQAWETTVQMTPVLRTRIFHSQSAGLVQAVLNESICWNESFESLDAYLQQDRDSSMDIGEPLARYCMIRDGSDKPKYFVWTMHHALYDGWSMKLIIEAINRAFRGEQMTSEWPQFQQFIKHLQDQDDEALKRYWRESLEGFDSAPYPEVPKSLTEQPVADSSVEHSFIHSQSKESGIMAATLVRAAWALVAGSASNSSDVVFGVTLSGRNAPISGIVNMPGPTITTVPVRIDTSSGQTVSSYLQKAQVQATTMISFEQYGLQRIAKVSSDAQRATQFQTLLVVQPAGDDDFMIDKSMGIFCDNKNQANWFNTQPLLIEVTLGKDTITASANFDSNVIPPWLVTRLLQRLEIVMQQLESAGPGTTLDQIDSVELSEAERVRISGNTDQKSLPSFSVRDQTQENGPKRQPVTEAERELHAIWSQVLILDPSDIGVDDSLFQLGGDSISAMMITGEARKIGIKLSVSDIFRTPTIRDLAIRMSWAPKGVSNAIVPLSHSDPVELSFAQGRLWFLEQLYPGLTWYLVPFAIRFRGVLQLDALEKSLHIIESRHDTLRSTLLTRNNVHFQQVHPFIPKRLPIVDMVNANEKSLSEALTKDQAATFDLTREAGWRVTVYKLGEEHHVLSVVMHHINSDGWSIQVFRKELVQLYSAAIKGHQLATHIRPLSVQYRDYSAWQKQKLINGEYQRQLDYWTDKLQTSRPVEFLTDKQRPKTLSGMAGEHEFTIEGSIFNRIQALCKEYAVTPFVILLAAFRATHYRMTGAEDATMGTPNANRDRSELKDVIGFFVNMLCFRLTVEDDSFESLVRQVQQQTMESFDNQDIPFEQIVFKLNRERDLSRHPIVQIIFAYHTRGTLDTVELEGVDSELLEPLPTTRFDLELHFFEEANSLKGAFIYSTDLYTSATMTNMLSVFMAVLEGALSEPRSKIATLPLLTAEGYTELKSMGLLEIHRTNYPREMSIVDVFQQQAATHPDKIAVKDSLSQITFAALNEKSDLVAQWLRTQGFSTETVIPVIARRSVETIIAFLGILKANMAYLPLDPNAPIERTKLVLSSLQRPTIILLGKSVRSTDIQDMKSISIQSVLEHRVQSTFFQRLRTHTKPSASSLAYVLYTSGSTGKPKGVIIEHRAILRLVLQSNCTQYLTRNGAVAHMANTVFDASTWEIYVAILNGLTLVCLDHELVLDHVALQKAFSEESIGAALFTPAHLKQILADSPMTLSQLDTLFVGGDRFDTEDCIQARRVVKGHIINAYGPTENTVISTMYHVEEGDSWANGLPIGRAISNSGAYIMDSQSNLQPLGVVGELVVTGDGLARGYTDSQLNTDRFVTVNIGGQQLRAYRTGDLARFRPVDGLIEFFGRADAQVKIRGHRVELGEIEHILLGHGSVADAVALIYQGEGQEPQVYAFAAVPSPMVYERMEVDDSSDAKGVEEVKDQEAEHIQVWSGAFDGDKYVSMGIDHGQILGRDFISWTSMYDGALIDRGEMNEWLDDTIAAMEQNLGAGHVLELGTGSGMILFNLVQGLKSYIGLDPSDRAVDYVNKAAQSIPSLANKVRVYKATADQVGQLPEPITPNIVICNSVAQYFPSQEYLFNVIDELVQKEGIETLFFGDMRSQAMYNEFRVTQVLSRSGHNISKADLRQSIAHIGRKEMEFLVDPGFFTGLQSRLPEFVQHVEILPKNMVATNELSCYRYAAVIHVKRRASGQQRVHTIQRQHWIDFAEQRLDRSALVQRLRDSSPQTVPLSNIPYNKTLHERLIVEHLAKSTNDASSDENDWVSSLRTVAQQYPSFSAYELKEIAKQTGYQVEISWARQFSLHGGFDAVFHQIEPDQEGTRVLFQFPNDYEGRPLHTMTSQPLLQQARQRVREELEARLRNHLPAYMVPKVITILDEMPVNASGKVDRKALAGTLRTRMALVRGEVREPNTKTEEKLQGIWARVLNISPDGIGLDDSFFQLGGDSITAMKVVNEARKLGIDLAVSDIFRSDNLEDLALQTLQNVGEADKDEEPVILVDEVTKSALLRELHASGTSIRSDQVADILPLTSMQKRYITDGCTNGLFVHYFFLDFSHDLDIERLKASLQQLLQSVPILRAAFLELKGKYWQVIPEVLDLPWVVRDVEESLPEALVDFCRADIKKVSFVEPPALFALLRNKTEGLRLVIRFSHAQYDGASFPAIIKPLIDGYFGRPTTTGADYSAFLAYIARRRPASISYWKDLLQGSSLTTIQPHISTGTQVLKPTHVSVQSEVTLPSLPSKFTTATLASAAWALLLAHTTGGKDIVYGHIVTGRNARICGPEEPVGPCLNVVPVRATLSLSQTPRELLRLLQMQFSSMGDADSLGYEDIIENCTNWPAGTQFESLIHHANINEHPEFDFGEHKVKLEFFNNSEMMLQHIMVMSNPVGNRLQFNILANTRIMSVEVAQTMVNKLCTIVCKMGAAVDEPISKWLDELRSSV